MCVLLCGDDEMRKMKDSGIEWIGLIPEDWEIKRLKAVLLERNESNNPIQTDYILSLTNDRGVIPYDEKGDVGNKSKDDISGYKIAYPNDIVLNSMNVVIGSVALSRYYGCVSPVYYMLYPRNPKDDVRYYNYIFQTTEFQNKLKGYGNGIMEIRMRIQMSKLNTVDLPVADSTTQSRIADFLDDKCGKIDRYIEKQRQIIEKMKAYKQSVITEAVTKGLDPTVPMKDSGVEWIGMIPAHWETKKIKYVTIIMRGKFNHRPRNDPDFYDGDYPFIQTGDVAQTDKYINTYSQTLNNRGYSVSKEFPSNSIVMTIAANVADVAILNFNACFPDSIVGFIPKHIDKTFLFYSLKAIRQQLLRNAIISTQLNLNIEIIKEEKIAIPPQNEQVRIAEYLDQKCDAIETAIKRIQQEISKVIEYKKSLIYEAVTGKLEV